MLLRLGLSNTSPVYSILTVTVFCDTVTVTDIPSSLAKF